MFAIEFMNATCFCVMCEEMDREPISPCRACDGHLVGRPWMVRSIFLWVHSSSMSSVAVRHNSSAPYSMIGRESAE